MGLYKGIFWYDSMRDKLIVKKVACDQDGSALNEVEYSSKSGDNFNHKAEWAKMPKSVTGGYPYNYYHRGRVEIKKNKATVYFNPALNTPRIFELIDAEFGLSSGTILVRTVSDGSSHYEYLVDYQPKRCTMCGKVFDFWDNQENFCLNHYFGYGSKYDMKHIKLNLCCECLDKVVDWLLPQCLTDPMSEYSYNEL